MTAPVAVLGFQLGRPGTAAELAALNRALAAELAAAGLLDYQPVQDGSRPERFCAYWLWADWHAREALWRAPPAPLRRFRAAAEPLWAEPPAVHRHRWEPGPPPAFCPADRVVRLEPAGTGRPDFPARLLAPGEPGAPAWVWRLAGADPPPTGAAWHPCGPALERRPT